MNKFLYISKKTYLVISSILFGIFVFTMLCTLHISSSLLNSSFHEKLFVKHDIYSGAYYVLETSIDKYITQIKKENPDYYNQQKEAFDMIEKTTTQEIVTKNVDNLRDGIFEYLSNERRFLPDLYLKVDSSSDTSATSPVPPELANVSKINLGAVLLYANRNDIVDYLAMSKLIYYSLSQIPSTLLPFVILIFFSAFILFKCFKEALDWLKSVFLTFGVLSFLSMVSCTLFAYVIIPRNISPITMTLSMEPKPVLGYIRDCVNPLILLLFASTVISIFIIQFIYRFTNRNLQKIGIQKSNHYDKSTNIYKVIKTLLIIFCLSVLASSFFNRLVDIKKDYTAYEFGAIVSKMKGVSTVSKVIPAKDALIYDVVIKIVDGRTEKPVSDLSINISGKSENKDKDFDISEKIGKDGEIKLSLDEGNFRLVFNSRNFPSAKYKLPTPIFFDLEFPSTKVITINLEPIPEPIPKTGFAEIELLDSDNKPISNVEVQIVGEPQAQGHPNTISSISNTNGIAVFKLNEGSYKVKFNSTKLPSQYMVPSEFDITTKTEKVSRYTIKVETKKENKNQ